MGINYKDAGVDVEAGYEAVRQMKQYVEKPTLPMSLEESAVWRHVFAGYIRYGRACAGGRH